MKTRRKRAETRTGSDFAALSVKDLLDAREEYHLHLLNLENVVATAVGRYRYLREDPADPPRGREVPRTLANSSVRDYSWPCVLVFVKRWIRPSTFRTTFDEIVPPRLYLPDGRVVPTCVVLAKPVSEPVRANAALRFPGTAVGGGYPILSDVQGATRLGTLGCLVTDGTYVYALTDAHVAGDTGTAVYTLLQGERVQVGTSVETRVRSLPFEKAFPGLPGRYSVSTLDAGLVRIEDVRRWTSQVYGIGAMGPMLDLNATNIGLDLLGRRVKGYGAATGAVSGEIHALFYRYKSIGGIDHVADLLIGPRADARNANADLTAHGNSGHVWFDDESRGARRPLALHWGTQKFAGASGSTQTEFALATSLGTACRELGVEVIRDLNLGMSETWGKVGHYKIGQAACRIVEAASGDANLSKLFKLNADRISFSNTEIEDINAALNSKSFVPLADVPDLVWKTSSAKRGREGPNHFADMDTVDPATGKTLFGLTPTSSKLNPATWNSFYVSVGTDVMHRGILPFRAWQLYDVMVAALKAKDVERYVAAAGVLAHYVGDACQPLHASRLHDGDPDTGRGEGVHSAYETRMLDTFAADLNVKVDKALPGAKLGSITSGRSAGFAVVRLMRNTFAAIPPQKLVDAYVALPSGKKAVEGLWQRFGKDTVGVMIDGAETLASIWRAAWKAGGGGQIAASKIKAASTSRLRAIYQDRTFAPSVTIAMLSVKSSRLVVATD